MPIKMTFIEEVVVVENLIAMQDVGNNYDLVSGLDLLWNVA